jgi:hypothetical protein
LNSQRAEFDQIKILLPLNLKGKFIGMAKAKKLTLKVFENKQLKERENLNGPYSPLYLMLTFNGKVKTIKSPTFELINDTNDRMDLIYENKGEIEQNDRRIFEGIRRLIEDKGQHFSLDFISQENENYLYLKSPIFDLIGKKVRMNLFTFFDYQRKLSSSALLFGTNYNWVVSIQHLKEVNHSLFLDFIYLYPRIENILDEFLKLRNQNFFPYIIDFEINNEKTKRLKELFNSI